MTRVVQIEDEMGGTCSTHARDKYIQFFRKTWREETNRNT